MNATEWKAEMAALREKKKREGLTKEEEDKLDFMEQKWDDWATDGENSY